MVIGNGMIATRFAPYQDREEFVLFASGVSNSKNNDMSAYNRETELLKKTIADHPGKAFIYFSTCSIYDPEEQAGLYTRHKIEKEEYIQQYATRYYIFRVSNIVGPSGNPNTVLNFFYHHLVHHINFDLWANTTRNLVDIDDVFAIGDHLLQRGEYENQIINIANPVSNNVKDIITTLEKVTQVNGNYITIPRGQPFEIDISLIQPVINQLQIPFGDSYLFNLVKKYYSHP